MIVPNQAIARTVKEHCRRTMILLLIAAWYPPSLSAQQPSNPQPLSRDIPLNHLWRAPGELLSEGRNTLPVGVLKLRTYRLEEVKLPQPVEIYREGIKMRVESAVRMTIVGGPFRPGPYAIWINDEPLENVSDEPTRLIGLVLDRSVLEHGATISVSYNVSMAELKDPDPLSILPDRLILPSGFITASRSPTIAGRTIKLRSIPSTGLLRGKDGVEIELTAADHNFGVRNGALILQVGKQDIALGEANGHKAVFTLTKEQFARAKDGAMVKVKVGPGAHLTFGRLDKSSLDR